MEHFIKFKSCREFNRLLRILAILKWKFMYENWPAELSQYPKNPLYRISSFQTSWRSINSLGRKCDTYVQVNKLQEPLKSKQDLSSSSQFKYSWFYYLLHLKTNLCCAVEATSRPIFVWVVSRMKVAYLWSYAGFCAFDLSGRTLNILLLPCISYFLQLLSNLSHPWVIQTILLITPNLYK